MQDMVNEVLERESGAISSANAKLAAALAKAQGEFRPIHKSREVSIRPKDQSKPPYRFKYADMEELISKTRPALAANGLAVMQSIGMDDHGQGFLDTVLMHADGGERYSRMPIPAFTKMDDPKQFGAAISYLRRYQYSAMLCLAADDDLDEDGSGVEDSSEKPARRQPAAKQTADKPAGNPAAVGAGEIAWVKKKLAALKLADEFLFEAHGIDSLEAMSMEQFADLKADLLKR